MIAFILKSSISLGILYACYHLFFSRDKRFMFNRFFLLAALVFSLVVPFITLPAPFQHDYFDDSHSQFTEGGIPIIRTAEKTSNGELGATGGIQGYPFAFIFFIIYATGVLVMAFRYLKNVLTIQGLIGRSEKHIDNGVHLALVNQPVSPFCFGRYVIVNKDAYTNGQVDEDIILHEKIHVSHGHTLDNLFIECLLMLYWFNPLLWCYRTALRANHEFCADHIASSRCGIGAYCYKLIDLTSGQYNNPLPGSSFNSSLTKNRILMMNRTKSPSFSFGRKLAVTGVAALIMLAVFSFKNVPSGSAPASGNAAFTVVIDAGHGGKDHGVHNEAKALLEKNLVMDIANAIDAVNKDPAIEFIYTRQGDQWLTLQDRVQLANDHHADLFLSLHINAHESAEVNGLEVYYSEKNAKSHLSASYCHLFASGVKLLQSPAAVKKANFIVLRENECPAVLLNLGFLTNEKEAAFLSSRKNQQKLAEEIVETVTKISKL